MRNFSQYNIVLKKKTTNLYNHYDFYIMLTDPNSTIKGKK